MPISWSSVSRDGIILAEAGQDDKDGGVVKAAQKISSVKPTAGWEKVKSGKHRGLKFHLHELANTELDGNYGEENSVKILLWTFSCVYDPNELSEDYAKAFLTKIVYVTEPLRGMPWWRDGGLLSAQPSFAPTLQQQMENVEQLGQLATLNQHLSETKEIMATNIENILERGEAIEELEDQASKLDEMSKVFKTKAKQVRKFKMWQNAKHGVVVGSAITTVVGVAVIPPLIALL
mmetsp:Transcript_24660/g.49977  ORF Transcript_24660/g.49977 Transcript_24660/m.49977 type:complete len:234 (+) Transcript_24660:178-879(+)